MNGIRTDSSWDTTLNWIRGLRKVIKVKVVRRRVKGKAWGRIAQIKNVFWLDNTHQKRNIAYTGWLENNSTWKITSTWVTWLFEIYY